MNELQIRKQNGTRIVYLVSDAFPDGLCLGSAENHGVKLIRVDDRIYILGGIGLTISSETVYHGIKLVDLMVENLVYTIKALYNKVKELQG